MEMIMKKEKHSDDKISEGTLHEILLQIKYTLNHLEDITADDRALLVKLVKQNNAIVEFLRDLQIDDVTEERFIESPVPGIDAEQEERYKKLDDLVQEFMNKKDSLRELEKELKKHKDKITPGQIGEA